MFKNEKPKLSPRQKNLQIVNAYVTIHDLNCHCEKPLHHILQQIYDQEPTLNKEKCLSTADAGTNPTGKETIDDFGPGELEQLFAEEGAADTAEG